MQVNVPIEGRPTSIPEVRLIGDDGNAFAIMARVITGLNRAGATNEFIAAYRREAMSADYNHLLVTSTAYLEACGCVDY